MQQTKDTSVRIKILCFSVIHEVLHIFLAGEALPENTLQSAMSLEKTVRYTFESTTQIPLQEQYYEQLFTLSTSDTEIAIVYYVLVPVTTILNTHHWQPFSQIPKTNHDFSIISYGVQRLQWKIEYTNVVYSLLANEFTLSELQQTYEAILAKPLDKRNFRKKILSLPFLTPTGKKRSGIARPAQMYQFIARKPEMIKIFR